MHHVQVLIVQHESKGAVLGVWTPNCTALAVKQAGAVASLAL
jgi:hypothetical protein